MAEGYPARAGSRRFNLRRAGHRVCDRVTVRDDPGWLGAADLRADETIKSLFALTPSASFAACPLRHMDC